MFEQIVLGIVQGIAEWLPISSEGAIFLVSSNFFGISEVEELLRQALFLHLGTFLAALIYFHRDVLRVLNTLFLYKSSSDQDRRLFKFLLATTVISGLIGFGVLQFLSSLDLTATARVINLAVGVLLLVTAYLQIRAGSGGLREEPVINKIDSLTLGVVQGIATLPGLSRSGLTVSALLLRKFRDDTALRLSFLMSLPIVLGGNILLNFRDLAFRPEMLVGLFFSFVFGLLTIHLLLKLAKQINFGYFVLFFAVLVLFSTII